VTIATINPIVANVMLVTELHGLLTLDERSRDPRRAIDLGDHPERGQQDKDRTEDTEPC
jgi:hypothetical protein